MKSVSCPHGDKGICTIPDRTAVVRDGELKVYSRKEVEAEFPQLDLRPAALRPLEQGTPAHDMFEAIEHGDHESGGGFAVQAAPPPGVESGVYVVCSCGHKFVAPAK